MLGLDAIQAVILVVAAIVAGLVRGFAGFGTALIYIPLAGTVLPPLWVLITLTVMDLVGPLPNVPRALREGRPRQVVVIGVAAVLALLPGLWLLGRMEDTVFRWLVAGLCLTTVGLMLGKWRWSGRMTPRILIGTGLVSGFLGGVSGFAGPPVILTYMSAPIPAAVVRGTILLYLVAWDIVFGTVLMVTGQLALEPVLLGAALIVPYLLANVVGAKLFNPARERLYRATAYVLIVAAAIMSLPILSG